MAQPKHVVPILLALWTASSFAATPSWVARSNALAQPVLEANMHFMPEMASWAGQESVDTEVADFKPQRFERMDAVSNQTSTFLKDALARETDPHVRQDLQIMLDSVQRQQESARLRHQLMLSYTSVSEIVFNGLHVLLDPRNKPDRQARALVRLRRYAGLDAGYTPLTDLARAAQQVELARPGLIGPYRDEVQQSLDNTEHYIKGLESEFTRAKLDGWQGPLATLAKQLRDQDQWIKTNVLPRARKEARNPPEIYADALEQMGVDISPDQLIQRATADYLEVRDQMQIVAARIAQSRHLPSTNYRDVILELKKAQVEPTAMLPLYWKRLKEIETIIRREHLITLPTREASIRLATEAESAQQPAPHMDPPRLIGNTGELGEFVIPLTNPHAKSAARFDDFTHDAVAWTLAAHEARPGHELQFASMVEQGSSLARALFAFNSANVEGWALYCESLLLPYMPEDGQLFSLQARLHRIARAFLDPMVNLGKITPDGAKRFLMEEVMLSEPMAQQEVDRYAFNDPGQATSYYYGYVQLRGLRTETEIALGKAFNLMAFNDFVVAQGLLPPNALRQAVMTEFVPGQLNRAKTGH